MSTNRWQQLTALYHAAMAREPSSRSGFVRRECGSDEALAQEVLSLLASPDSAAAFLSSPAAHGPETSVRAGEMIGQYRIEELIGRGGMGEVYRARDTRLGRSVAIKILPRALTRDEDRLARFESEARVLAALNHPQIGAIYGIEEHQGTRALVLEFVDGRTLDALIPCSVEQAQMFARQIAEALDAAHERGIVHRDLKPANIKVTADGIVKVLDFGLAKVHSGALTQPDSGERQMTALETAEGLILGTVAYMSPEQARGQIVDKRTDIWAFGCVLYEMLTGRRPFEGQTMSDVLAAILEREPDWAALPAATPAGVRRLLERCLDKNLKRRFRDIGDARHDLDAPAGTALAERLGAPGPSRAMSRRGWLVLATVPAAAAFLAGHYVGSRPRPLPTFRRITFRRGLIWSARFSASGQEVLYSATWDGETNQLYSTRPENPESRPLAQGDADILSVSRSGEMAIVLKPSRRGGFTRGTLARVGMSGVAPRPISEDVVAADWSPGGEALALVRVVGRRYQLEYPAGKPIYESAVRITEIRVAPDGKAVALCDARSVKIVSLDGREQVLSDGWQIAYALAWSPAGDEVWFGASELASGRNTARVFGVSRQGRRVRTILELPTGALLRDLASDGRVLISTGTSAKGLRHRARATGAERDLSWMDWSLAADLSADGSTLLFSEGGSAGAVGRSVYVRRIDGSPAIKLGSGTALALSNDGTMALAMDGATGGRLIALPIGAGQPRTLTAEGFVCTWAGWFPGDKQILLDGGPAGSPPRTWILNVDTTSLDPVTPENVRDSLLSRDGKWFLAGRPAKLYSLAGGEPRAISGWDAVDDPIGWDRDNRHVYVRRDFQPEDENKVPIFRVDVVTGRREPWSEVVPENGRRAAETVPIAMSRDGQTMVYTYHVAHSSLYVVEGLR